MKKQIKRNLEKLGPWIIIFIVLNSSYIFKESITELIFNIVLLVVLLFLFIRDMFLYKKDLRKTLTDLNLRNKIILIVTIILAIFFSAIVVLKTVFM